jgi:uncharacterized protein YyaL (SSP411 family)
MVASLIEQNQTVTSDDARARELLDAATAAIEASFARDERGWGRAPKFPNR